MTIGIIAVLIPIQTPLPRPVVLICPKCQTRIPVNSKFCLECGTNLQPKKQQQVLEEQHESSSQRTRGADYYF